MYMTTIKTVLY